MTSSIAAPPTTLPTEYPDEMLTIARELGAPHYAHLFLTFTERLDAKRLARALRLLVDAEPVLGCRFEITGKRSQWRRHADPDAVPWLEVATAPDHDTAVTRVLLAEQVPTDLSIVVRLFSLPSHDVMAVTVDHAAGDGQALFECVYHLAELYSILRERPDHRPVPNPTSRDGFAWQHGLSLRDKAQTLIRDMSGGGRTKRPSGVPSAHTLESWKAVPRTSPAYVEGRIGPAELDAMNNLARRDGTSEFTLLIAAMGRAFVDFAGPETSQPFHVQTVTNLRRFAPKSERPPIYNMLAHASVIFDPAREAPFAVTLENAKREMERLRGAGVRGVLNPLAALLVRHLSYAAKRSLSEKAFRSRFRQPVPLTFSHAGRVDEARTRFDGTAPERILLIGGVLPMPVLLIAGMEYRRNLLLSIGYQADDISGERLRRFADGIAAQIPIRPAHPDRPDGALQSSDANTKISMQPASGNAADVAGYAQTSLVSPKSSL